MVAAAICMLLLAAGFAVRAHAVGGLARSAGAVNWMAAVALPLPSPGDVSYGVERVRIMPGSRLASPAGVAGAQTIFAARVGGLAVAARSSGWSSLRATTHVYVVVSAVPSAGRSIRDIAFFILRRKTPGAHANGSAVFTIANAQAQVGSFWVHGVDGSGYANVFAVRNILSTALANWSRYIRALQLAHALAAAAHPLLAEVAPSASAAAARVRSPGPWTGGQRADARVVAIYHLIFGALRDPNSYAAVKKDPLVASFIRNELGNRALATRWSQVVAQVPLKVPDKYAAAAQEEKRFTRVVAPKISHSVVSIFDDLNSSDLGAGDGLPNPPPQIHMTVVKAGSGSGTVTQADGGTTGIDCGPICSTTFKGGLGFVELTATPASGSTFAGWSGPCTPLFLANQCESFVLADTTVTARFTANGGATDQLAVVDHSVNPGATGTVTSNPAGINCGASCAASFGSGSSVTLTATPNAGYYFDYWGGCTSVSGRVCTVVMGSPAVSVQAYFG
jgi:hypothetical protein